MANRYASGKFAIAECDRCGQRYKLTELKKQVVKTKLFQIKVCPTCWDPDQPQLSLGLYPVYDPQAVREPRPDVSYYQSGNNSVNIGEGYPDEGSRVFQWGWYPVGGSQGIDDGLTPNDLTLSVQIGTVTITTT
jgi:hypothetical protein